MKAAILILLALGSVAHAGKKHRDRTADVRAAIEASLPDDLGAITIEVPDRLVRARGELHVTWKRAPRAGWTSAEVKVGTREAWVRVELGTLRPVVVALRALDAGHVIDTGDLGIASLPVDGLDVTIDALAGALVLHDVAARAAITEDNIELPAAAARGTEVDVVVHAGGMTVSARGTLEESARIGESVGVRIAATRRVMRGRLAKADVVEVTP